jgi:peptide/nickel transport system substrate-binding protein
MRFSSAFRVAAVAATVFTLFGAAAGQAQTLTIGVRAGPESIDPHYTSTGTHAETLKHVFDTLIWAGDNLELQPRLAESWSAIDDTTWEFKLRHGVKFHDGSDFTANDVKFSIERSRKSAGPSPTSVYVRRVKDVTIVDPYTVRVQTNGPAPTLPNDFVRLFIVSEKAARDFSTQETANPGFNSGKAAIGTGPYKFVSWVPKDQLVLERFDGFWGGREPWERVVRKELSNDAARVAQLKAGQVDVIARTPSSDIATLERDPKIAVVSIGTIYIFNLEFDFREKAPQITAKDGSALAKNPFLDKRVREAFDLAIDREAIAEISTEGQAKPASQLVTPNIFGYNDKLKVTKPDVKRAKQLLAEAGYQDGFKVPLSFTNDRLPGDKEVGTTLAQMLAQIGIAVTANAQPTAVFFPARQRGEYSLSMWGWATSTGEAHYTLSSLNHSFDAAKGAGNYNVTGYSNPKLDEAIDQAGVALDEGKRRSLLQEGLAISAEDRPRLPIVIIGTAWAAQKAKVTVTPRVDEDTLAMNIKPVGAR